MAQDPSARFPSMNELVAALSPTRRTRRRAFGGAVAVLAVAAIAAGGVREYRTARCRDDLPARWARPFAATARAEDVAKLQAYAHAREVEAMEWCDAKAVSTDAQLCSEQRLARFEALVRALGSAEVNRVSEAVQLLVTDNTCAPDAAASFDTRLLDAQATFDIGRWRESAVLAREIADADPNSVIAVRALLLEGRAHIRSGAYPQAETAFHAAIKSAHGAGDDSGAMVAFTQQGFVIGHLRDRPEEGLRYSELARPLLERLDATPEQWAEWHSHRASLEIRRHATAEAIEEAKRSVDMRRKYWGDHHLMVSYSLAAYGDALGAAGRFEESRTAMSEAIDIRSSLLGPQHPLVAGVLVGRSFMERILGRPDAARRDAENAIEAFAAGTGNRGAVFGICYRALGEAHEALGNKQAAIRAYRESIARFEDTLGRDTVRLVPVLLDLARLAPAEAQALRSRAERLAQPDLGLQGIVLAERAYVERGPHARKMAREALALMEQAPDGENVEAIKKAEAVLEDEGASARP
jgi:tetratricopeptide (TPR) repeat protein